MAKYLPLPSTRRPCSEGARTNTEVGANAQAKRAAGCSTMRWATRVGRPGVWLTESACLLCTKILNWF